MIINSIHDDLINPCLKNKFAEEMRKKGEYAGSEFGRSIRLRRMNSSHDSTIWSIGYADMKDALTDAHNDSQ